MKKSHKDLDIKEMLKNVSLKITKNRLLVLELLILESKPMSIEDIFKKLKKINQVTVYRIIEQFVLKGLVYETNLRSGRAYFEFQRHHHHHIVCKDCGCLEEIDICVPEGFLNQVKKQSKDFGIISEHALEFFGTCKNCKK